jgi:homoserine kinase
VVADAGPWLVGKRCRVRVPATSANLGPGFDALGLALGLYDVVEAEVVPHGLEIRVEGEGAGHLPLDDQHLVVQALLAAAQAFGVERPPGLRLSAHNAIPHGRGLGSSAAAVVAGVTLLDLLAPGGGPARDLLPLAGRLEGHPDNVAAALLGGLTIAWCDESAVARAVRLQPHASVEPVVLVPEHRLDTRHARSVLPREVSHDDAARTAGRAALLVHALTTDPGLLLPATEDWLHQQPRSGAMPETLELMSRLRADGHAAVVSGAGPSVLVLCVGDPDGGLGPAAEQLLARPPAGWRALAPGVAFQGTRGGRRRTPGEVGGDPPGPAAGDLDPGGFAR